MNQPQFEFDWDEQKALANLLKHGITFELASTAFRDPRILTTADLDHSPEEERWLSTGIAENGALLSIVYLWTQGESGTIKVRLISARKATANELKQYEDMA